MSSLERFCSNYHLFVFAFDNASYEYLAKQDLKNSTIIPLEDFENEKLLNVKELRTKGEYCWTCTSSTIKYCIDNYSIDHCTYLDADLYFFNDPRILLNEVLTDQNTLITDHRYTKIYDQSKTSGKYCVQFITFFNNNESMKALNWWVDSCIEWCYARVEDGKFGDQKYIESFPTKFSNIHVLKHLGGGVAPWNVQQYNFFQKQGIYGIEKKTGKEFELVFYHFHALKYIENNKVELSVYDLKKDIINLLYKPYIKEIDSINKSFSNKEKNQFVIIQNKVSLNNYSLKIIIKKIFEDIYTIPRFIKLKMNNNIFPIKYFTD